MQGAPQCGARDRSGRTTSLSSGHTKCTRRGSADAPRRQRRLPIPTNPLIYQGFARTSQDITEPSQAPGSVCHKVLRSQSAGTFKEMTMTESMTSPRHVAVLALAFLASACASQEDDGCNETVHCLRLEDGTIACETGYHWLDPTNAGDFTCVTDLACEPTTCRKEGKNCGTLDDGCGTTLSCGTCATPNTCGGGGEVNVCGPESCSTADPCSQGCCGADAVCKGGSSATACGAAGACVDCTAEPSGHRCLTGVCGCNTTTDCGFGDVCDVQGHLCVPACDATSCETGCCDDSGFCATGTGAQSCGSSGMCVDCSTASIGKACVNGTCGCNTTSDCPTGRACNLATKTCTTTCSASQACNGGCCNNGTCTTGSSTSTCGYNGLACDNCAVSTDGDSCMSGPSGYHCGCTSAVWDCPVGKACNPTTRQCTSDCSASSPCHGGCCSAGRCAPGTATNACGEDGSTCDSCAGCNRGTVCRASTDGGYCGCNNADDCSASACWDHNSCAYLSFLGGTVCCGAEGASCGSSEDCCSGSCSGINSVMTCD